MVKVSVTVTAPDSQAIDWVYRHACRYTSGRSHRTNTDGLVSMDIFWILDNARLENAHEEIQDYLDIIECESVGADIERITVSECD